MTELTMLAMFVLAAVAAVLVFAPVLWLARLLVRAEEAGVFDDV